MQTSWSGGATTNTGVHPTNASNWTEYGSKDSSISATTALSLQTTAGSQTQTTDTDFNAGNNSSTTVFGMGSGADVKLSGGAYAVQGQAVTQDYSTGVNPYGVAFDNITNSVWVAN